MRRRWRARRYGAEAEPPFGEDVPPWTTEGPDQWSQGWAVPRLDDAAPTLQPGAHPAPPAPRPEPAPDAAPTPTVDVSAELVRVLEVVTTMCGHVIGFVEADREERRLAMQADREERRAMIDALSLLIRRIGNEPAIGGRPRERVLGGSMASGPATVIELRELENAREVCCRLGDQWLEGFEISEKVEDELGVRYRLRRRSDGEVLPELFVPSDIRLADAFDAINTFDELSATAIQQGNWSAAPAKPERDVPESADPEDPDRSPTRH